ncbi:DUF3039 domain-containing protein [Alloscardovia venturai]|uniref:DUF3039 domain-containing protein n=1 Tax=Alloscardovia venturai TaxID=1769421 RepID=A0ABW2Y3W5_9BIFI
MTFTDGFDNPLTPDSGSGAGTSTLERTETATQEDTKLSDNSDSERYAHYVSREKMEQSRLTGKPVVALCGKVWIPTRNPDGYPVCPECKKIYAQMMG